MDSFSEGNEGFYQESDLPVRQAERARAANSDPAQAVLPVFCPDCRQARFAVDGSASPSPREVLQASMRVKARRSP